MADNVTRPTGTSVSSLSPQPHHHPLLALRDEIDRLFDSFFPPAFGRSLLDLEPWSGRAFRSLGDGMPNLDIRRRADHYEIAAEMPGIDRKDVAVTVQDRMLSISGETRSESRGETGAQRRFGSFRRLLRLPQDADAAAIGAEFDAGVLTVTVPRHEDSGPRDHKVEIKGS